MVLSSLVLLVLAATSSSGCAGTLHHGPPIENPHVDVTAVSMEMFSLRSVGGQLELHVVNPNPVAVPLRYVEWELSVDGDSVVRGRTEVTGQIPAKGAAPISAALEVVTTDAERVAPHLAEGSRDYQLRGVLHFQTASGGDLKVPFESQGTL